MVMESTRRPFDRTLSKEPGLKKPRLAEDSAASDRSLIARAGFIQQPVPSSSSIGRRAQRAGNSESSDSVRGPSQLQQGHLLHQELVNQYKNALSELTFNSKPIITNLTIIAGENLHAAKVIAETVYANILEVPKDQKLPSLYLLDSIVKNIGRDYIKHFAPRLPEVFCKAYRQVDPSIHQGMRHLFGTWKGVFPPQTLHMIEKELGFIATANGSSSGAATLRPDSQVQRPAGPAHSIHVNPKYLESRQRIPNTSPRGSDGEINGALVSSHNDVEASGRTASTKNYRRVQVNEPVPAREKRSSMALLDSEYGSSVSGRSGSITGRVGEKFKEQELDDSFWYESGSDTDIEKLSSQKNGFGMKHRVGNCAVGQSADSDSHLEMKKNLTANSGGRSWRNSDEEEYMWDDIKGRPTGHGAAQTAGSLFKDSWAPASFEKLDFDGYQQRPQSLHDNRPSIDDEASVKFVSKKTDKEVNFVSAKIDEEMSETLGPFSLTEDVDPPDGRMLLAPGKNVSHSSVGYLTGSKGYLNATDRTLRPQIHRVPTEEQNHSFSRNVMSKSMVAVTRQRQMHAAALSSTQSAGQQRPPSPSVSIRNPIELNKSVGHNRTSFGAPTDPRRPPEQRNTGPPDQFSLDSMPSLSRDVHQSNAQRLNPQSLQASSAAMPPLQQRNHVASSRVRKLEVAGLESSGDGRNSLLPQAPASDHSLIGSSSSERSNPLTVDSPGQSIDSKLTAGIKGALLCRASPLDSSSKLGSREVLHKLSTGDPLPGSFPSLHIHENVHLLKYPQKEEDQPLSPPANDPSPLPGLGAEEAPTAVSSTSNPFSSLFSSLMAKGLISGSKSDALSSSSTLMATQQICGDPMDSSTISSPDSSVQVTREEPLISVNNKPAPELAAKSSNDLSVPKDVIKNLIGFDFRPDVIRNLHPDVLADLFADLPHQCDTCGIRLKIEHSLAQHMEWHALREQNQLNRNSRMWYAGLFNWVDQNCDIHVSESSSDRVGESSVELEDVEQMVTADESQLACILCGNMFEDFYCRERNEWMFKGAVHLNIPIINSSEQSGNVSDPDSLGPIVHANCISEDSIQDLGLDSDLKQEKDLKFPVWVRDGGALY